MSAGLPIASAQLQGHVYLDGNADGHFTATRERGLANIRVRAYDRLGQLLATVSSDTSGQYQFPNLPSGPLRIQFSNWSAEYSPAPGQFSTRFTTTARTTFDMGLYRPTNFLGDGARIAVSVQPLGDHTDHRADSLSVGSIVLLEPQNSKAAPQRLVKPAETGSVWGLAHDRVTSQLYSAAFAKRHSGFGPLGSGGIYRTDLTTGKTNPFVSLDALGIPTGPTRLSRRLGKYSDPMPDSLLFGWVGKMGLGGVDVTDDGKALFVVNLFDQKLYGLRMPAGGQSPTAGDLTAYPLPQPACRGGHFRPFAVKYHQEQVYVGGVCDAAQSGRSTDLEAYVFAIDPVSGKSHPVVSLPLDYQRGTIDYGRGNWLAWTDDPATVMLPEPAWWAIYPQPILADLEFDTDGSLLLGLMDRLGHQMATGKSSADGHWQSVVSLAAGDVLRAAPKRRQFRLEANALAGDRHSAGYGNGQGPAGGEFYYDDTFVSQGVTYHQENGMGGLAVLPDRDQVLVSSREPIAEYNSAGVVLYDNHSGKKTGGLIAYHHNPAVEFVGRKTNHVGDLEVIGAVPATELGHRVWQDCNENGLQDADEQGLADVQVELWHNGQRVALTRTDSAGLYRFSSVDSVGRIQTQNAYQLRVPLRQSRYPQLQLVSKVESADGAINNDASTRDQYAVIDLRTTAAGENQLALDFGFQCIDKPRAALRLQCSGQTGREAQARLLLTDTAPTERYRTGTAPPAAAMTDYEAARPVPANQVLWTQSLLDLDTSALQVRIIQPSGCYQSLSASLRDAPECARLRKALEEQGEGRLTVGPNPTTSTVRLSYRLWLAKTTEVTIRLTNERGELVYRQQLRPVNGRVEATLNLSHLNAAQYILTLDEADQRISRRLVKH